MSYQPKSFRKFMAASLSTAVVASAVAPAVTNADAKFTDVESGDWFAEAVNYLTDKQVLNGYADGTFRPGEDVTRAEAAKIMATTLELDTENAEAPDFSDVKEDAWYASSISALVEEGVIGGYEDGTFRPDETLTRAEMAKLIVEAYDIEAAENTDTPFEDLDENGAKWAKEYIAALYEAGIVDGVKEGSFAPNANVTRAQVAAFVHKTETSDAIGNPEEPEQPGNAVVEDAKATNLIQVEVTFNNENFDEDEVKDIANYEIEDKDKDELDIKEIDVEGSKAIITLEEAAENQTDATLTIDEAVAGEEVEFDLNFFDNEIPELEDLKVVGKNTVKVMFNEPMNLAGNSDAKDEFKIKIGNKSYSVKSITPLKNGKEANITVYGSFNEGELSLAIGNGLEDFAGFNLVPVTETVDVVKDEEAPEVVDYKDAEPNKVTLVFNEDIKLQDDDVANFYHTNTGNKVKEDGVTVDGNELTLTFDEDDKMPEGTAYIYIKEGAISDLWDNENNDDIRTAVEVTGDEEAPELDEVEATNERATLTFSEDLDEDSAEDAGNYTILDDSGKEVKNAVRRAVLDGDTVVLHFNEDKVDNGEYTLQIEDVEDLNDNKIDRITQEFTVEDEEAPQLEEVLRKDVKAGEEYKLIVRFSEKMDVDGKYSVLDLGVYDLTDGTNTINLQDLADEKDVDVDIDAVEDGKAVEITVDGADLSAYNELAIARVADQSGNFTNIGAKKAITSVEDSSIEVTEAVATAKDAVEVTFSSALEDIELNDFKLFADADKDGKLDEGEETIALSNVEKIDSDEVKFELDDDISSDVEGMAYTIVTVGTESENRYGATLKKDVSVALADEIAPSVAEDENDKKKVSVVNNNQVKIEFDEAVKWVNNGTFEINGGNVDVADITVDGKVVTITVADDEKVYKGDTVDQVTAIADAKGNKTTGLQLKVEKEATE